MDDPTQSPKRRHILSSINTERTRERTNKRPRRKESEEPGPDPDLPSQHDAPQDSQRRHDDASHTKEPRRGRLKLKVQKSRRRRSRDAEAHDASRRHHHHHRHRRRHRSPTPPNPHEPAPLDPDVAFRESLFDAMADDEGAAYWEGVYGQPVHVYASEKVGPAGELEQMTDEEYAEHVRRRMWEKTHAGLLEGRARRDEERKKKKEEERQSRKLHEEMEQSLRRGEERRQKRRWVDRWAEYVKGWSDWDGTPETLAWPLESGRREDINEKDVRLFFIHGLGLEEVGEKIFVAKLKDERVRWHPDKMQQRLGGKVDDEVMKDVTAIFQIIDRLWGETRAKP